MILPRGNLTRHNVMELWLFDFCNFRCGYCGLVENGDVTKHEQLDPYRDLNYVDQLVRFFRENRPSNRPLAVTLTGGEPLFMPNIDYFTTELAKLGDTIAIYSNLSIPLGKALSETAIDAVSYLEASFHPDWHMGKLKKEVFFNNVLEVKKLGVPVLVRFVGAPQLLDQLTELEERCQEIGVTFMPTTLFNVNYPKNYTQDEKDYLSSYMVGYSSLIQLDGGMDVSDKKCLAADRLYAARLHKGGDVTPCISTMTPVLGNIFENKLKSISGPNKCFKSDKLCTCDIHFQQNLVSDADDSQEFELILQGKANKLAPTYSEWKLENKVQTKNSQWLVKVLLFKTYRSY